MASALRLAPLLRSTAVRRSLVQTSALGNGTLVQQSRAYTWEPAADTSTNVTTQLITSPVLPWAELSTFNVLTAPYTYFSMYSLDFLLQYSPWWGAIMGTAVVTRMLFFPLAIKQNRIAAKTHNILPDIQRLQKKINDAYATGNQYEVAVTKTKLAALQKEHGVSTKQRLVPLLIQMPSFVVTFLLMRRYCNIPLESLGTGGTLWFQNLLLPDPFFILPIMSCLSTYVILERGVDGQSPTASAPPFIRWGMRALCFGSLAFFYNFPSGMILYLATNNFLSMTNAFILTRPWVMNRFNIPKRIKHDPKDLVMANMSFMSQAQMSMDTARAGKTSLEVRRLDDLAFKKAGIGPIKKTYRTNPKLSKE